MDRPGTGMRGMGGGPLGPPGTALRPPTGMRGLPGTQMRVGTAAQRPGSRAGLGPLNTNVQVADRPVTQQGMMGMKVANQGPGRQVADKSYYMGELRKKCDELSTEINKMNGEAEQHNKDNITYTQMERKYESLIKEVRKLQGDLADYNLIVDKSRTNTDPADIAATYQQLKARNDAERRKVDEIFTERQDKEAEIKQLEQQAVQVQQQAEEKLNQLTQEQRMQYAQLQDDHQRLEADVLLKQRTYDNMCLQVSKFEQVLQSEPNKQRMNVLQEQRMKLMTRKQELHNSLNQPVLSEAEQREMLLKQVKEDNQHIAVTTRNIEELDQKIQITQKELDQLETGGGSESEDLKKYQKLQEKDQEMSEFIDKFEETHTRELELVKDTERRILALMEHISKQLSRSSQVPNQDGFQDLQSDLSYKQRNLENAQTTQERLAQEKEMREMEHEKINNLDQKITNELESLNERKNTMTEELKTFNNIQGLRENADKVRNQMNERKVAFDARRKGLKQQVQSLSAEYDKLKQTLASNEVASTLEALEQKLRHYEQNIFHLKDFIESKEAETDYSQVYDEVSKYVADVNLLLQQMQTVTRPY